MGGGNWRRSTVTQLTFRPCATEGFKAPFPGNCLQGSREGGGCTWTSPFWPGSVPKLKLIFPIEKWQGSVYEDQN